MPIFRRNCIHTASGIVALCISLHSTPVESGLQSILYYDARSKKHQIIQDNFLSTFSASLCRMYITYDRSMKTINGRGEILDKFSWLRFNVSQT